jgi:hypothetical protein
LGIKGLRKDSHDSGNLAAGRPITQRFEQSAPPVGHFRLAQSGVAFQQNWFAQLHAKKKDAVARAGSVMYPRFSNPQLTS